MVRARTQLLPCVYESAHDAHARCVEHARLHLSDGRPYVTVRAGLEAAIARPVYYELAELALEEGADPPGLWSDGMFFPLAGA